MDRWSCFQRGLIRPDAMSLFVLALSCGWALSASAYPQYSQNGGDATNCGSCHGDFRAGVYISLTDGQNWGNLHNLHRTTMLNGDCDTCHGGADRFPVLLDDSNGGDGLASVSCVGCHGRAEDNVPANPEENGYGAGLRQHHFNAGVNICTDCHQDANPANYTTADENVLPPYYANPGTGHPLMPTDPCNPDGNEDFAGIAEGLDNDGNNVYDGNDSSCSAADVEEPAVVADGVGLSNYPNPFRGATAIEFEVPAATPVEIRILDVHGRQVRHLDLGSAVSGPQRVEWDGRDDADREVPSGMYLYEVRMGNERSQRAMVLLR